MSSASMPADRFERLDAGLRGLVDQGYKVTTSPTARGGTESPPGWVPYRIEVRGNDGGIWWLRNRKEEVAAAEGHAAPNKA